MDLLRTAMDRNNIPSTSAENSTISSNGDDQLGGKDFSTPKKRPAPFEIPGAPKKQRVARRLNFFDPMTPPPDMLKNLDPETQGIIKEHWHSMMEYSKTSKVQSIHNLRLHDYLNLKQTLQYIFESQNSAFKINASIGHILKSNKTQRLRYFHSSSNNAKILEKPMSIHNQQDFDSFIENLTDRNFSETGLSSDTSEWTSVFQTNLTLYFNHLEFPIGARTNKTMKC